jgi:hypothetical protein
MHPPKAKSTQLKEKKKKKKGFYHSSKELQNCHKKRYLSYQRKIINHKQFAMILEIKNGKKLKKRERNGPRPESIIITTISQTLEEKRSHALKNQKVRS